MSDLLWYAFLVVSTIYPLYSMARGWARIQSLTTRAKMPKFGAIARDK